MKFLDGLDKDLKRTVLNQLRDIWTHTSTALEGNSLTLGETSFVLNEGLTIGGKSLREHHEIVGHAKAIDIIFELLANDKTITTDDLFTLHKAVQTQVVMDIYEPVGDWKNEQNGTYGRDSQGKMIFINFASPDDVPILMAQWLNKINDYLTQSLDAQSVLHAYTVLHIAFVWIHPFADGNGRMARLLANLVILKAGLPPIVIAKERRQKYLALLNRFNEQMGEANRHKSIDLPIDAIQDFMSFAKECWQESLHIVEQAKQIQATRNSTL
ncbi:MAG: Fic family protein [Pseudomonadales bacterium]|nr:Fic family protein [Pseudomonadales bacterium]